MRETRNGRDGLRRPKSRVPALSNNLPIDIFPQFERAWVFLQSLVKKRMADKIALRIVGAQLSQLMQRFFIFHMFGNHSDS